METQPSDSLQLRRVREIAAGCLSKKGQEGLSHVLTQDESALFSCVSMTGFTVNQDSLDFSDAGSRDQFAAEHFFECGFIIDGSFDPIATALKIRSQEDGREQGVAGRYLALVQGQTNIFQSAADAVKKGNHRTFGVVDVVQSALPYIEAPSIEGLISLCDAQYEHKKQDFMGNGFFDVFGDCYKDRLDLFRLIIEDVCEHFRDSIAQLYTMSVLRISETEPGEATERLLRDVESTNSLLKETAIRALGKLIFLEQVPDTQLLASTDYLNNLATDLDENIRSSVYMVITEGALVYPPLANTLNGLLDSKDQDLMGIFASTLFRHVDQAECNPNFDHWVMALSTLPSSEKRAIDDLDYILVNQLKKGRQEFVLSVLEAWILHETRKMLERGELTKLFDSTFHELLGEESIRSRLITCWLIRDEHQMQNAVEAILSELYLRGVYQIGFAPEIISTFDADDFILLTRRMLGWVTHEEHLVSLSISLMPVASADKNLLPLVEKVLINEVVFNFPALSYKRLGELKMTTKNVEIRALCDRIIASSDIYFDALKALPQIEELRPSGDLQAKAQKQKWRVMAEQFKTGEANSIIQLIATRIPLKAGCASFSIQDRKMGKSVDLHLHEHRITLPRRYVLDAVGYELTRLFYINAKRGQ